MKEQYLSRLLHSEIQTHIFHLQMQNYAAHVAIGDFYDGISDFNDDLIEQCQGTHNMIYVNYQLDPIINLSDNPKLTAANVQMVITTLKIYILF